MEMQGLREICEKKIEFCALAKDEKQKDLLMKIKVILADDNAFHKMDAAVAMNILVDLDFNEKEAKDIYANLLKK